MSYLAMFSWDFLVDKKCAVLSYAWLQEATGVNYWVFIEAKQYSEFGASLKF